jgi:hypothetical protein
VTRDCDALGRATLLLAMGERPMRWQLGFANHESLGINTDSFRRQASTEFRRYIAASSGMAYLPERHSCLVAALVTKRSQLRTFSLWNLDNVED